MSSYSRPPRAATEGLRPDWETEAAAENGRYPTPHATALPPASAGRPAEAPAVDPPPCADPPALAAVLAELVELLPGLRAALDRQARPGVPRLAYRLSEVADALGLSRRSLERAVASRQWPPADLRLGRTRLWRVATIESWLTQQTAGRRGGAR